VAVARVGTTFERRESLVRNINAYITLLGRVLVVFLCVRAV